MSRADWISFGCLIGGFAGGMLVAWIRDRLRR
jgi:hypothetical protein